MSDVNKRYTVRTRKLPRRFRAGHCFWQEATTLELTPTQAEMVKADPELVCKEVEDETPTEPTPPQPPAAQKAKTEAKAK